MDDQAILNETVDLTLRYQIEELEDHLRSATELPPDQAFAFTEQLGELQSTRTLINHMRRARTFNRANATNLGILAVLGIGSFAAPAITATTEEQEVPDLIDLR